MMDNMPGPFQLLQRLPEELLQDILERLEDLTALNLVSKKYHRFATPLIWRKVDLRDCRTVHEDGQEDDHDDSPLLRKLLVIAKNPWIGSCVSTLTHSCHLPPPALFHELPRHPLSGETLSPDPRTAALVQLAVKNLTGVQTLRIIFGHPNINDVLLRCFFNEKRPTSIRRLWLENCRISVGCSTKLVNHPLQLPAKLNFSGLESIRLRRLPVRPAMRFNSELPIGNFVHAREGQPTDLINGAGGVYPTTTSDASFELRLNEQFIQKEDAYNEKDPWTLEWSLDQPSRFDDFIYYKLGLQTTLPEEVTACNIPTHADRAMYANRGAWLDPDAHELRQHPMGYKIFQREQQPSSMAMIDTLSSCSATLTSLCLDWVFTMPYHTDAVAWSATFLELFALRFPNLKAFQYRNAVVEPTVIPPELYLMDYSKMYVRNRMVEEAEETCEPTVSWYRDLSPLEFMEAHPNLQCLSWPIDRFLSGKRLPSDIASRVGTVIENLSRTLVDLRVDAMYSGLGELQTESYNCADHMMRERRRSFISDVASKMSRLTSIKIEGGIPRDERREIARALHRCPLEKIVMIGVCCPLGNHWGVGGRDLNETFNPGELELLEAEHKDAVHHLGPKEPEPRKQDFRFEPTYGWPPGPPMIYTLASRHADTVRELKFCGYKGAPILFNPTPITHPMLAGLRHFHHLESLIMSMWLNTEFEDSHRDADIINYWLDARSPSSTSLMRITDEEPEGWEKELRTKYSPDALAGWITSFLGQFLSEKAKAAKNGVHIRISMCIGDWGGIFDIDLWIKKRSTGLGDVCFGYKGPREELEPDRRRGKLENRRWF